MEELEEIKVRIGEIEDLMGEYDTLTPEIIFSLKQEIDNFKGKIKDIKENENINNRKTI